jgi:hypothetical protein
VIIVGESAKIEWGFEARTRFDWIHNGWNLLAGGKWISADRGAPYDLRRGVVKAFLRIELLEALQEHLSSLRGSGAVSCSFAEGEEIFGVELDYSSPYLCHFEAVQQVAISRDDPAFASCSLSLLLAEAPRLLSPAAPDWGSLIYPFEDETSIEQQARSNPWMNGGGSRAWDAQRNRSYSATFELCPDEMLAVKQAVLADRNGTISLPSQSFRSIFGSSQAPPYDVVLLEWGSERRIGLNQWSVSLRFGLQ